MSNESTDLNPVTDHSYDGILEYDNPLPGWWKFLFWVSIFFAPVYWLYFEGGIEGRTVHDEYDRHMASVFEQRFEEMGLLEPDRETLLSCLDDPDLLKVGKVVYKTNCVSCHGADGGGLVGPNLTDGYWKNVNRIEDIANVITNGAANGAMPPWKTRLSHQNLIVLTSAYVASMQDNPVSGKPPEGKEIGPWK